MPSLLVQVTLVPAVTLSDVMEKAMLFIDTRASAATCIVAPIAAAALLQASITVPVIVIVIMQRMIKRFFISVFLIKPLPDKAAMILAAFLKFNIWRMAAGAYEQTLILVQ